MNLFYEIFGMVFMVSAYNKQDMEYFLSNMCGRIVSTNVEAEGFFTFKKISEDEIDNFIYDIQYKEKRAVLVEPTGEKSDIYYTKKEIICVYSKYYCVTYEYGKNNIHFYYSNKFLSIAELIPEFFKYYILKKRIMHKVFPFHSSCIQRISSGKNILLIGESGSGKSSSALYAAFTDNFNYCNDEITFVFRKGINFETLTTKDMVKICEPMFEDLSYFGDIEYKVTSTGEYLCNVDFLRKLSEASEYNELEKIYILKRNDKLEDVLLVDCNTKEKFERLLDNSNISIWTNLADKMEIVKNICDIISNVDIKTINYPIERIGALHEYL